MQKYHANWVSDHIEAVSQDCKVGGEEIMGQQVQMKQGVKL